MLARYEDFLTQYGAKEVKHSGRTLFDHLKGTHDFLREWGQPGYVCLGGLFHSIYGTRHFRHKCLPLDQRKTLEALVGTAAENLVYLFCVTDRPKIFFDSASIYTRNLYDYHAKKMVEVSPVVKSHLVEIEAANLLDQGSRGPRLERLLLNSISPGCRAAVISRIGLDGPFPPPLEQHPK